MRAIATYFLIFTLLYSLFLGSAPAYAADKTGITSPEPLVFERVPPEEAKELLKGFKKTEAPSEAATPEERFLSGGLYAGRALAAKAGFMTSAVILPSLFLREPGLQLLAFNFGSTLVMWDTFTLPSYRNWALQKLAEPTGDLHSKFKLAIYKGAANGFAVGTCVLALRALAAHLSQ